MILPFQGSASGVGAPFEKISLNFLCLEVVITTTERAEWPLFGTWKISIPRKLFLLLERLPSEWVEARAT